MTQEISPSTAKLPTPQGRGFLWSTVWRIQIDRRIQTTRGSDRRDDDPIPRRAVELKGIHVRDHVHPATAGTLGSNDSSTCESSREEGSARDFQQGDLIIPRV